MPDGPKVQGVGTRSSVPRHRKAGEICRALAPRQRSASRLRYKPDCCGRGSQAESGGVRFPVTVPAGSGELRAAPTFPQLRLAEGSRAAGRARHSAAIESCLD